MGRWTFARKLALAFGIMGVLTIAVATIGSYALRNVVESKDHVIDVSGQNALRAQRLDTLAQQQRGALRDFLLFRDEQYVDEIRAVQQQFEQLLAELDSSVVTQEGATMVRELRRLAQDFRMAADRAVSQARVSPRTEELNTALNDELAPRRTALESAVTAFLAREERLLDEGRERATADADRAVRAQLIVAAVAIIAALIGSSLLTRTLTSQIGAALHDVQSSSAELHASANQQASSSREQATAMAEITTTIAELLATSRQIAESAQRVARIAEETASAAQTGEETVGSTSETIAAIRKQVDGIVSHMLDLGRKSQEIGGILEIINELADQTNILSVNAAIEAAGAGEAGRRFAVVAEEIRKLADRVAGSTKEIRSLIQEVRAAVNTTVMTTEATAKSADAGVERFTAVSTAFRQISGLVRATTDAAREIELSTKQQASAVEQVNMGVTDVAQGAKETEVASSQMLETVSRLSGLSRDLSALIRVERVS